MQTSSLIKNTPLKRKALSATIAAALFAAVQPSLLAQDTQDEAGETASLEEIIVTAQRRDQTLAEIPYNISAVSGDYIESGKIMSTGELLQEENLRLQEETLEMKRQLETRKLVERAKGILQYKFHVTEEEA